MSSTPNYDAEFCGKVPLHVINTIQPYGALLVLDRSSLTVIQVSENVEGIFGVAAPALTRTFIGDYLDAEALAFLQQLAVGMPTDKIPSVWTVQARQFPALIHVREKYILVETESTPYREEDQHSFVSIYQKIKYSMALIEAAATTEEVCSAAARELKKVSGFDKVMIYSFDEEWNGTVIAEEKRADMESFLGYTFPASDIPRQARDLYLRNPYRFIPDRTYQPVRLYPVMNPQTRAFTDLSDCNVRGVAAVHLEYLANMDVTASMSTRILSNDRLWGLIACHHKTAMPFSFELCAIFELLSHTISARIFSLHNKEKHETVTRLQDSYTRIIEQVCEKEDAPEGLFESDQTALSLFGAAGALYVRGREWYTSGVLPEKDKVEELLLWLQSRRLTRNFSSEQLSAEFDEAGSYNDMASGLLAIPVNTGKNEYLLFFRPEVEKIIDWGGNPDGRIVFEKDEKNYHPRNSFKQWRQIVKGSSLPWKEEQLAVAEILRSFLYEHSNKQA
ncbi:MAG TPA: GAF domain-containing protein [Puia sp.]|jgi:light-regulated signal transduction histidine kinase (bacteriophytochrome)|nr:GAF domain-containing protein [Puia sp.]